MTNYILSLDGNGYKYQPRKGLKNTLYTKVQGLTQVIITALIFYLHLHTHKQRQAGCYLIKY